MLLLAVAGAAAAQSVRIDFDDRAAPTCVFSGAERIADQWAAQGVRFSALAPFQTGAIVEQATCFPAVSGHSAPNLVAYVGGLADLPLVLDFDPPVESLSLLATNWNGVDDITLRAFDVLGAELGSDSVSTIGMVGPLQRLEVIALGIVRAELSNSSFNDDIALDDLVFVPMAVAIEACCFPDGSCLDLAPGDCAAQGGLAQGPGIDCAVAACPAPEPPGWLPDGATRPGTPLRVRRGALAGELFLDWSLGCNPAVSDATLHEGSLGLWYSHAAVLCDTGGALVSAVLRPGAGSRYFLAAPVTADEEGSYGLDSRGLERPASAPPSCRPAQVFGCP